MLSVIQNREVPLYRGSFIHYLMALWLHGTRVTVHYREVSSVFVLERFDSISGMCLLSTKLMIHCLDCMYIVLAKA